MIRIKDCTAPAWIDADIRQLQNKKETAWRKAKTTDTPQSWESFRKFRNRLKNLIHEKYTDYGNSLGAMISENPKRFWSYFRAKTRTRSLPQVARATVDCIRSCR